MKKLIKILSLLLTVVMLSANLPLLNAAAAEQYMWPVPRSTNNPSYSADYGYINIRGGDAVVATKSGTVIYVYTGCKNNSALTTNKGCSSSTCSPNAGFYTNKSYNIKLCNWGYGNGFILKHSDGTGYTFYGHMGSINVKKNQTVSRGDIVGKMGASGLTFDSNLYYAVSKSYKTSGTYLSPVNPINVSKYSINYIYTHPTNTVNFSKPSASNITSSSATLNCPFTYNTTFVKALCLVVYNPDGTVKDDVVLAEYGSSVGSVTKTVSKTVTGLKPSSQYSYRFYVRVPAKAGYDVLYGPTAKFTTAALQPESVTLDKTYIELSVGQTVTIHSDVLPSNVSQTVNWTSSDAAVASVSNGVVTAKKEGTILITAATANGKKATCTVKVTKNTVPSIGIALNPTSLSLTEGSTGKFTATIYPSNSTDSISWKSSDTSVATVSGGVVTAKKAGTAKITATTTSGKATTCTVTVSKKVVPATAVKLSTTSLKLVVGASSTLTATITPYDSTDTVSWKSSNSSVASVANGVVTAKNVGTATITVTTSNGKSATCTVTVSKVQKKWTTANQYYFGNSYDNFITGSYTITDADFNKLSNYVRKQYNEADARFVIDRLRAERACRWEGSCYGMSVTALLDFDDRISMMENFDPNAATLHDVDSPRVNSAVQSAINYYQLSQFIGFIGDEDGAYYDKAFANWKEGLISLVNKTKTGNPMLFTYMWADSANRYYGHAIVIKAYGGTDSNGNHKLVAYDNRYPTGDIIVLVDKNYSYCMVNGTENALGVQFLSDFSMFDKIDIDGPDNNMVINYHGGSITSSGKTTDISVVLNGDVTIWDDNDNYITVNNGKISSTMDIKSKRLVVNSTADGKAGPAEIIFTVADSDTFTFESTGDMLQASVLSGDAYAGINANNAVAATISETDGISVSGDKAAFTVYKSVNDEDCEMFCFTGVSTGVSSINYQNGSVYVGGNNPGSIKVGKFTSNDYEELTFVSQKESVEIKLVADEYDIGDVDNDGALSASDARLALRRSVKLENFAVGSKAFKAADVDFDGNVTASDARMILRASVKLETLKKKK